MFWEGRRAATGVAVALCAALAGCGGGDSGGVAAAAPAVSAQAAAGKALFFDKSLSASAEQSCATCHVPSRAFTADPATDRGLPVPLGGRHMDLPGFRNAPSLVYAHLTPAFFLDDDTPTGGFFRDGRASSLEVQAQQPLSASSRWATAARPRSSRACRTRRRLSNSSWRPSARRCLPTRTRRSPTYGARVRRWQRADRYRRGDR